MTLRTILVHARGYTQQGRTTPHPWYVFPVAHDFELHVSGQALISQALAAYLTQLAILLFWSASHLFHIAWLGNFFVQARFVGLVHFAVGYVFTYGPFVIAATLSL